MREAMIGHKHGHGHGHGPGHGAGPGFGPGVWNHRRQARERWRGRPGNWQDFETGEGFGFWGGRSHGGPRGHRDRLERGLLRYIILDLLRDGPKHGYEIIKRFEERTQGQYAPSPGTLYPTLQYLDDLGMIRADQEAERKTYQITNEGRAELEGHAELVEHFWSRFADQTPANVSRHELKFLHDSLHDLIRTIGGGVHAVMHGGYPDTIRRVRLALEKCQNEIREIIAQGASTQPSHQDHQAQHAPHPNEPHES